VGQGIYGVAQCGEGATVFDGHYQPHIPADLGFYDLRLAENRQAQADLAREYGIYGFCYYHYWFNGKELLERPIQEVLATGKPDFPFCICWANENWTRRWDGGENEILMQQAYSLEDDLDHIHHLLPFLRDPRYIRINGQPLLIIYRVDELPNPKQTAELWREEARRAELPDLYLCHVISSGVHDPNPAHYGCDAAIEFQPDWRNLPDPIPPKRRGLRRRIDPHDPYAIHAVHRYPDLVEAAFQAPDPEYKVFSCVTPSWDNSPRRLRSANIFIENTPELYKAWLKKAIERTCRRHLGDERVVFINAWNEWAEGNHLEPDIRWGHAYLEATKAALNHQKPPE